MHDVYVWGDSHWRVFFPFVNHGSPGVFHEHDGIRVVDMVANELSGATMYGLLNDRSKNGARTRILSDLRQLGTQGIVENVALVFGEVDVRYHNHRYFNGGVLDESSVLRLLLRYKQFIEHDLFRSGLVRQNVFVYYGFAYPQGEATLLQPGQPMGESVYRARALHQAISEMLPTVLGFTSHGVHTVTAQHPKTELMVSGDGVHLVPELIFPLTHSAMETVLV